MKRTYIFLAVALASAASAVTVASAQSNLPAARLSSAATVQLPIRVSAASSSAARAARCMSSRGILQYGDDAGDKRVLSQYRML